MGDQVMSELIAALREDALRTVYPRASGRTPEEADCMLKFKGSGKLDVVIATVADGRSDAQSAGRIRAPGFQRQ